jgi:hypothetical protein
MTIILITFVIFGVLMSAMAIGVMSGRKPLRGSCGGTGSACSCSATDAKACTEASAQSVKMSPPGHLIALDRLKE